MTEIKVITPEDLGRGLTFNTNTNQYEAISQISFTGREATVALLINDMELVFREVLGANRPMLLTGVKYNGTWYGDSPDDTPATNPFTNEAVPPLGNIPTLTEPVVPEGLVKVAVKKVTVTMPMLDRTTTVDIGLAFNKVINISARVKTTSTKQVIFNTLEVSSDNSEGTEITIKNTATSRFNGKEAILYVTYEV